MIWWWVGNAILILVVAPLVVVLANRLVREVLDIKHYAADILEHGIAVADNLDPVPALADTARLVETAKQGAARYAEAVGRFLRGR